jgi:hypothetical protein
VHDSEVLAWVERWASTYWQRAPLRMSIAGRPGRQANYYEVEVVLPAEAAIVRLELDEDGTLVVGGVLGPYE